jgi:Probable sensor domain DACNK/DisA bacterial checkpoint controller nucleotide-binding
VATDPSVSGRRIDRLVEELGDEGFEFGGTAEWRSMLLEELDYALHPRVHERRVPSYGALVEPTVESDWEVATELHMTRRPIGRVAPKYARAFADGMSSWIIRRSEYDDELVVFDRPAGSERDMVVLSEATGGTMVQRHPNGNVRCAGAFGVLRFDGIRWQHASPIGPWIDAVGSGPLHGDRRTIERLLEFAVHDLGSRSIGALLVYRPDGDDGAGVEERMPEPPPLQIHRPADLAPLRHVLSQTDGAAVFDSSGTLRQLGVRLVPSAEAESDVEGYRGMRHTAGRRYSFDDPQATVIVVSDDGPVTVLRNGELFGWSALT